MVPPAAAATITVVGTLKGKPTSMEAPPDAEKELEAMPNLNALFFNGTFNTASDSSSRLCAWTRTCLSTYPFDPGIDNYLRSLPDLANSLRPRKLITANGFVNTAIATSDTDDGSDPRNWTWSPYSNPSAPRAADCDFTWPSFDVSDVTEFANSSSNANDVVDNATCFDHKYPNAWRLPPWPDDDEQAGAWFPPLKVHEWFLPPWPDDDELGAKAEPLDERRPEPRHQLNDGQHHSDKPCNTNYDGYTLPSAKPC